jgi:hypothetical protein
VRRAIAIAALVVSALALILVPATAASADGVTTTTTFAASASQTAVFGSNWVMPITVAGTGQYPPPVDGTSGTVNIVIEGQPGTYATGLPLAPGGAAFFSPTSSKPPLGAGVYKVSAVFVPSTGSGLSPSQSSTPATLTITAIALRTSFAVQSVTLHGQPGAQVVAEVRPPANHQGIPAGSWSVKATGPGGTVAFQKTVATKANPAGVTTVELAPGLKPGTNYAISATFAPQASIAGGYAVTNGKAQPTTIAAKSIGEILSTSVNSSPLELGLVGLGFLLLVATAIVLLVTAKPKTDQDANPPVAGAPVAAGE